MNLRLLLKAPLYRRLQLDAPAPILTSPWKDLSSIAGRPIPETTSLVLHHDNACQGPYLSLSSATCQPGLPKPSKGERLLTDSAHLWTNATEYLTAFLGRSHHALGSIARLSSCRSCARCSSRCHQHPSVHAYPREPVPRTSAVAALWHRTVEICNSTTYQDRKCSQYGHIVPSILRCVRASHDTGLRRTLPQASLAALGNISKVYVLYPAQQSKGRQ